MENHISRFVGVSFQSHQLATPGDMEACNDSFQFEDLEDQICSTKSRAMLYMVALLLSNSLKAVIMFWLV
jgi:hypothetical protein